VEPRDGAAERAKDVETSVVRTVVENDDLRRETERLKIGGQLLEERLQVLGLVVGRDENGEVEVRGCAHAGAAARFRCHSHCLRSPSRIAVAGA